MLSHFKNINDSYAHDIADEILTLMGEIAKDQIGEHDLLARFGGEEFIMLLTDTRVKKAQSIADWICEQMSKTTFQLNENEHISFSISIGFAQFSPYYHDFA